MKFTVRQRLPHHFFVSCIGLILRELLLVRAKVERCINDLFANRYEILSADNIPITKHMRTAQYLKTFIGTHLRKPNPRVIAKMAFVIMARVAPTQMMKGA